MTKKFLLILLTCLAVSSCSTAYGSSSSSPNLRTHPPEQQPITVLQAVNASLTVESRYSRMSGPDGLAIAPVITNVEFLSYSEAFPDSNHATGQSGPVWLIEMHGAWEPDAPVGAPASQPVSKITVYVDGLTGVVQSWTSS